MPRWTLGLSRVRITERLPVTSSHQIADPMNTPATIDGAVQASRSAPPPPSPSPANSAANERIVDGFIIVRANVAAYERASPPPTRHGPRLGRPGPDRAEPQVRHRQAADDPQPRLLADQHVRDRDQPERRDRAVDAVRRRHAQPRGHPGEEAARQRLPHAEQAHRPDRRRHGEAEREPPDERPKQECVHVAVLSPGGADHNKKHPQVSGGVPSREPSVTDAEPDSPRCGAAAARWRRRSFGLASAELMPQAYLIPLSLWERAGVG